MKLGSALIAAAAGMACGAARSAPLEAYGRLPTMDMVSISPDGSKVAFVQVVNGKQAVVVDQLSPAAVVGEMPPTEQKVRGLEWADNSHLVVIKSMSGYAQDGLYSDLGEWTLAYGFDLAKKKVTALYNKSSNGGNASLISDNQIVAFNGIGRLTLRTVDGHPMAFADGLAFVDRSAVSALLSQDLGSNSQRVVENAFDPAQSRHWYFDDKGVARVQTTCDQKTHDWTLRIKRNNSWADAYSVKALIETPEFVGFSADGGSALLRLVKDDGFTDTKAVSLADGKLGPAGRDYDSYSSLISDPATRRVIGGMKIALEPTYEFFDAKDQA